MMNVAVVGTGYVGLVAGACFAELGHRVVCVDNDPRKLATLRAGKVPIYEPGLAALIPGNVAAGRLTFTDDLRTAVQESEVIFVAVGTPPKADGSADLRFVTQVAEQIADALNGFKVVVMKSTVPIGTCDSVRAIIASRSQEDFAVVSNPEFLREGVAVPDFMEPDRIVVGASDERAFTVMDTLYAPLTDKGAKLLRMDLRSSEMTKYASNSMLAVRISFINEIANLCEKVGADIENVRAGMGEDKRIGPFFLKAGVGYGGSCFPKDVAALLQTSREYTSELGMLKATVEANEHQKRKLAHMVAHDLGDDLTGKRIAIWGLAFKPETDDMREAPSLVIIEALLAAGAELIAYDPAAHETAARLLGDRITYAADPYAALDGADALCLITEWKCFKQPDWDEVGRRMRGRFLYDGRNIWEPKALFAKGFSYRGIGRRLD